MMMRFAITASDRYMGVFEAFINAGWQPVKLFTSPDNSITHHSKAVVEYAQRLGLDVQFSRLTKSDLDDLAQRGCDVLIIASYAWRIPDWQPYLKYAINFHPSLLPDGRGPYPIVQALLDEKKTWGITCHKVTEAFDAGDILDNRTFPIADDECHESLDLKIQIAARQLAHQVAIDFSELWDNAKPQGTGSYTTLWSDQDRTIDFSETTADILRRLRAFGLIECIADINEVTISIKRAVGWTESHQHVPGTPIHVNGLSIVVAVKDGYIGIIEWSLLDPNAATEKILHAL
jgi:methionyl-tRNA formyltransferase